MACAVDELFGFLSFQASPLLTSQQEARKQEPSSALPPGFVVVWEFTSVLQPFIHCPDHRRFRRSMRGCGLSPPQTCLLERRPSAILVEMNGDALHVPLAELVTFHAPRLEAGNLARISRVALGLGHAAKVVALGFCARAQVECEWTCSLCSMSRRGISPFRVQQHGTRRTDAFVRSELHGSEGVLPLNFRLDQQRESQATGCAFSCCSGFGRRLQRSPRALGSVELDDITRRMCEAPMVCHNAARVGCWMALELASLRIGAFGIWTGKVVTHYAAQGQPDGAWRTLCDGDAGK